MIIKTSVENRIRILIILLGSLFFLSFNGLVHLFDWDEINFAESAREMIVSGNYDTVQINFIPFWEKPPLYIWLQVLSMKTFGINEFAARFPNAVCGIITLLVLFEIGRKLKDTKFALFWVVAYGASVLPFLYFKSGIIDPWFNLFIFLSLYFAFMHFECRANHSNKKIHLLLSALSIGLAVLTKGPVAILLFGITMLIFIVFERKLRLVTISDLILWGLAVLTIGGAYHIYQLIIGNGQLILEFFKYQVLLLKTEDAGHGGSIFYHPIVLFVGVFPSSILALQALFDKSNRKDFSLLMIILFWVVLIIFSLVRTKIVHYSSLCYFPMSYLAALTLYKISVEKIQIPKTITIFLVIIGGLFAVSPALLQLITSDSLRPFLQKYVHDDFALACLDKSIYWSGWEFLSGIILATPLVFSLFVDGIKKILLIYGSTIIFIMVFMLLLIPKIEGYSQKAAIDFIVETSQKDPKSRITSLDYKSYAPLFYSNKMSRACVCPDEDEYLLTDPSTVNSYFVAKIIHLEEILKTRPQLEVVKKDGGFVLLHRIK